MSAPVPKGRWAWKFEQCSGCSTKKVRHKGNGLCLRCHDKNRAKNPNRKRVLKANHDRWYMRVKGTGEYKKYCVDRAAVWRKESDKYPLFLEKQYVRLKFRRIAKNLAERKGRILRRNQGVQYRCEICPDGHVVTSPVKSDPNNNLFMYYLEMFKKEMAKACRQRVESTPAMF